MQVEEFRVINDYPNYEVSNLGNVRNTKTGRFLKPDINKGYYYVVLSKNCKAKKFRIHRLVGEAFLANPYNKPFIDHIDGVRTNNNVSNLRYATNQENQMNSSMNKNNTSGYKGVHFDRKIQKYRARIQHNGKLLSLGSFDTKEEAALARLEKAKEIYGDFMNDCENKITININAQQVIINN